MRPIDNVPVPKVNNLAKRYSTYQEWRLDLVEAYGQHCVYCNDRLPNNLQVEHEVAQSLGLVGSLVWDNLHMACGPCNLAKSNTVINQNTHYLPNIHNTQMIFDYVVRPHGTLKGKLACIPVPKSILTVPQKTKALATINDLELDRVEQTPLRQRKMTDVRWQNRFDAFEMTKQQRKLWNTLISPAQKKEYIKGIKPMIIKAGFFSLWYDAFNTVPEVLKEIINSLPNTSQICFDPTQGYIAVHRNRQNTTDPI